jgi:cobaltochelatase CobT
VRFNFEAKQNEILGPSGQRRRVFGENLMKNDAKIKDNLTALLQAITGNEALQTEFRSDVENNFFSLNSNLISAEEKVVLPEILGGEEVFIKSHRASADLAACYLLFHQKNLHPKKSSSEEQKFFDEFEKARLLCKVKEVYFGAAKNILDKIERDLEASNSNLSLLLIKKVFADFSLLKTDFFSQELSKKISKNLLKKIHDLSKKLDDQKSFAESVEEVLELLKNEEEAQEKESQKEKKDQANKPQNDLENFGAEGSQTSENQDFASKEEEENSEKEIPQEEQKQQKISEGEFSEKDSAKLDLQEVSEKEKIEFKKAYKVYSSKFDEIVFPQKLIAKNELENLRDQLDLKLGKLSGISKKMTLQLKKKLLSKQNSFLEFDSSQGVLDRKKISRIITNPLSDDIWVTSKNHEYQNTVLTILLDNSGSMRGNPIVMSAMACEIIAKILEKFRVKTEIIGFTTADWKGGRVRKLWELNGKIKNPGRLNELRHIIYKHFSQNFKQAKVNLGLMLKEGILKENIDGEALLFARGRLMQQSEKRKILLVISDGTPVDDSTLSTNDGDILPDHLHFVINKIEKQSKIEVVGIGIGHEIGDFYRNSISIKNLDELGDAMIKKIVNLL